MDILISEDFNAPAVEQLGLNYSLVRLPALWKDPPALKTHIGGARTILIRNQTQITADVLAAAPHLLAVGRLGVGLDNIDVPAATKYGVVIIAPVDANAVSVAELTLGLILALARKIPFADRSTKAGHWDRKSCTGIELAGKSLAVCGFGRIGKLVAARASAFGMRLLIFDPFINADSPALLQHGATLSSTLDRAIATADFVSVHSPLTADTTRMFNAQAFAAMKRGAFFINASRGGLVDETALLDALQSGHLAGAALDVRQTEPPTVGALENLGNVILTPHIGSFSIEAQTRTFEAVCLDLDRILKGQSAINYVNQPAPGIKLSKPSSSS